MNKGKANGRMNKNKLIDILIVYADKLHLVEWQMIELASICRYRHFEIRPFVQFADKLHLVEWQMIELASICRYRQFEIRQFDSICR